jgi:hypothetical protein
MGKRFNKVNDESEIQRNILIPKDIEEINLETIKRFKNI